MRGLVKQAALLFVMALAMIICAGCASDEPTTANTQTLDPDSPSAKVIEDLEAFSFEGYENPLFDGSDEPDLSKVSDEEYAEYLAMFESFDYEIVDETIKGDTADVKVRISTYPFGGVIDDLMDGALSGTVSEELDDAETLKMLIDSLVACSEMSYQKTVTIHCAKSDGEWSTDANVENEDLCNAVSGGYIERAIAWKEWLESATPFIGVWYAVGIEYEGTVMSPDEAGLDFEVDIAPDGTMQAFTNGEDDGTGDWTVQGEFIYITDSTGAELYGNMDGEYLVIDFGDDFIVTLEKYE